jgi:RNA polymerase sigma-70 factor, ECF subfamily
VAGETTIDLALVIRAQAGDQAAFETLVERYQSLVSTYTGQLLENIPEAEDVAQEVFLKAFQEIKSLRDPQRVGGWLKSIAWRECRGWVRKQQAARRAAKYLDAPPIFFDPAMDEDTSGDEPWLQRLEQTIESLGEGRKTVLAMFYIRGLSHEMIADFLEIPIGTIKRRLFEARQALAASTAANEMDIAEQRRFVEAFKRLLLKTDERVTRKDTP